MTNAQAHIDSKVILKMDIEDFFPTVTAARVKGIFRKAGYREQVAILLAQICTEAPREVVQHGDKTYYVALGPPMSATGGSDQSGTPPTRSV